MSGSGYDAVVDVDDEHAGQIHCFTLADLL
jgi:hypothetical protein